MSEALPFDASGCALSDELRRQIVAPRSLHALIEGGLSVSNVVIQDEFTHDVIVAVGDFFAVYDST